MVKKPPLNSKTTRQLIQLTWQQYLDQKDIYGSSDALYYISDKNLYVRQEGSNKKGTVVVPQYYILYNSSFNSYKEQAGGNPGIYIVKKDTEIDLYFYDGDIFYSLQTGGGTAAYVNSGVLYV